MQKWAKNEVFDRFFKIRASDGPDIAYNNNNNNTNNNNNNNTI